MRSETVTSVPYIPRQPRALPVNFKLIVGLVAVLLSFVLLLASGLFVLVACAAYRLAHPPVALPASNPLQAVGLPYRDISFASRSGTASVHGWYIPSDSRDTIVFSHGYGTNREEPWVPMYEMAKEAHVRHYNVILFDYLYSDGTGRHAMTGGVRESDQLLGAIDYARSQGARDVAVWGYSMGAGTALQAALKDGRGITAMVLDSTYILEPESLYAELESRLDLPKGPTMAMLHLILPLVSGVTWGQIPYDQIRHAQFPMPIYFVHGMKDRKASYETVETIASNQEDTPHSGLWLVPRGIHEMMYRTDTTAYLTRTFGFLRTVEGGSAAIASKRS